MLTTSRNSKLFPMFFYYDPFWIENTLFYYLGTVMLNQLGFPDWQCCNETFIKVTSISCNMTLDFLVSGTFLAMHIGPWATSHSRSRDLRYLGVTFKLFGHDLQMSLPKSASGGWGNLALMHKTKSDNLRSSLQRCKHELNCSLYGCLVALFAIWWSPSTE